MKKGVGKSLLSNLFNENTNIGESSLLGATFEQASPLDRDRDHRHEIRQDRENTKGERDR